MLLYFTGNGNSYTAAKELGDRLGEPLMRIAKPWASPACRDDSRVVWVMPVYCWGIPPAVVEYIDSLPSDAFAAVARHYLVLTCGDDVGMTHRQWRAKMAERGWRAASAYSVQMPNTYVLLPGFDVDPKELADKKLAASHERIELIGSSIARGDDGIDDVTPGAMPHLKSSIYPLWRRWDIHPSKFRATDACIGCGRCARSCPLGNIEMEERRPRWGADCTLCLGCYNCCPVHAVAYGCRTKGKGQYFTASPDRKNKPER